MLVQAYILILYSIQLNSAKQNGFKTALGIKPCATSAAIIRRTCPKEICIIWEERHSRAFKEYLHLQGCLQKCAIESLFTFASSCRPLSRIGSLPGWTRTSKNIFEVIVHNLKFYEYCFNYFQMVFDEAEWTTPIGNALEGSYSSSVRFQIMHKH